MSVQRGQHVWYDLMTTDTAGAIAFYHAVVGWEIHPFEGGDEPYDMWTVREQPIGGVMELPEEARAAGAPTHWMAHIATPDVDETARRATELGGTVLVPPQDIPSVGRFAVIRDPFGAVFGAFALAREMDLPQGRAEPGRVSWHELMTDDVEQAHGFYQDLFGWGQGLAMDMGEYGVYQLVRVGEVDFGGMMRRPKEMPVSAWLYYLNVTDLDGALERVQSAGGRVLHGPMEVPDGDRVAQCMDPQGGAFALHMYGEG